MTRILYIIDSLKIGGAEMLLLGLLDAVKKRGDIAHVAYFSPGPLESAVAARGIEATRLSEKGLRDPLAMIRALQLIRRWRPDIVHTHLIKSDLVGQLAARLSRRRRIITLHNTDPWRRNRKMSFAYRAATSGADACIAVSDRVAEHVAQYGGYRRDRIDTIVNGIDLGRFDPEVVDPLDLSPYGVEPGVPVIAVIGSLTEQKDHENFLRAAALLAPHRSRPHFLIVGEGPLRDRIANSMGEMGLPPERVTLTGAILEMPELLAAIDMLVISSGWEGLPMTLLEGMAMRRPVVSTAVGGIPDVVVDGVNGSLVPPSDPQALATAMERMLADPIRAEEIGIAARRTVSTRFSAEVMRQRLCDLYDATLADAQPPDMPETLA
ncbi:MAG: glycosyltransferase [Limimaricola soesokkakensis]|uniref:glycosyltransferase n=1 Tax=Limimaricola soesokkakensis TaxID=1343159 RepID=UPI00405A0456